MRRFHKTSSARVINTRKNPRLFLRKIQNLAMRALSLMGKNVDLTLVFVSDPEIRRLNREFRSTDRYTDVLAFDMSPRWSYLKTQRNLVGEVYISTDRVLAHARAFGAEPNEELARYVLHGILHLLGQNDGNPRDKKRMVQREEHWLKRLCGFGPFIRTETTRH